MERKKKVGVVVLQTKIMGWAFRRPLGMGG